MNFTLEKMQALIKLHGEKLKQIKCVALDCDGVLTNGLITYQGQEMGWNRASHTSDGYGIKLLMGAGIKVGVISGGNSLGIHKRYQESLGCSFTFFGNEDKREAYLELLNMGFKDQEILYMGDELFDIPLLKRCGFSATVPHASLEVKAVCDYVTGREGGQGSVREVIDMLRFAQDIKVNIPEFE